MKNTLKIILALFVSAVVVVVACKKKTNNTAPAQSLNQVFADLKTLPQNFNITAGTDTVILGADSTILHFYTNSFKDAAGNIINSGIINIQLVEMYKPGDMIANRTATVTRDSLLASGGEINITATMGGQTIYANKYGIGFKQSAASTQQMELYYGGNANTDSLTIWTKGNNTTPGTTSLAKPIDSFAFYSALRTYFYLHIPKDAPYYFFDSCTGLGSANCDCIYPRTTWDYTTLSVIVPDASYDKSNTQIFMIFPRQQGRYYTMSVPVNSYNGTTNTFSLNYDGTQIPVGLNYELAVITNKNGNYYYFEQSGVTTNGLTVTAAMAPETKGDIAARLHAL